MKSNPSICIYCQAEPATTDDHIPPENIYASPKPADRLYVPSCDTCNKSFSKDDEYFRLKIGFNDKARGHEDIDQIIPVMFRSLDRPQAKGLRQMYLNDLQSVPTFTQSGLYVGDSTAYNVALPRIFRVVERTVRGLYFIVTSEMLLPSCHMHTESDDTIDRGGSDEANHIRQTIVAPLLEQPENTIGRNVFSYRYSIVAPPVSAWLLTFYGSINFLTVSLGDQPHPRGDFENPLVS